MLLAVALTTGRLIGLCPKLFAEASDSEGPQAHVHHTVPGTCCCKAPFAAVSFVEARPPSKERKQKGWSRAAGPPRGHWSPLWAVIPPLQVVLSSACSVASLGRCPSHYLPGRPSLRQGVLAAHLFGWGIPSTQLTGHVTVHNASSAKSPCGAQGGVTLPNDTTSQGCVTKFVQNLPWLAATRAQQDI